MRLVCSLISCLLLTCVLQACASYQYPGLILSPLKISYERIDSHDGVDLEASPIDPGDFVPAGGSMLVERGNDTNSAGKFGLEVFQPLPFGFIAGLSGDYLFFSSYGQNVFFAQGLRYYRLNWWDPVSSEGYDLERTPSIGGYFGKQFWTKRGLTGLLIQYGASISGYKIVHHKMAGVDRYGAQNYSYVKSSENIASGMVFRQTIEIGFGEAIRLGFWWEVSGNTKIGGIQLIGSMTISKFASLGCDDPNHPGKRFLAPIEDIRRYEEDCRDR